MTEAWAWGRSEEELVDRSDSPWDDPNRRPSHADKRRAWRRELLAEEIHAALHPGITEEEIRPLPNGCSAWPHDSTAIAESTDRWNNRTNFAGGHSHAVPELARR